MPDVQPEVEPTTPEPDVHAVDLIDSIDTEPEPASSPEPEPSASDHSKTEEPEPSGKTEAEPEPDDPLSDDLKDLVTKKDPEKEPEPEPEPELKTPRQLREAYQNTKSERDKFRAELEELRENQSKAEEDFSRKAKSSVESELKTKQERIDELETRVRFLDYTQSDEYKEKFEAPIRNAINRAAEDIDGMTVDSEDGERDATIQDVIALTRIPAGKAAVVAREMFGDAAIEIMNHRRQIMELDRNRNSALEEWKAKGSEQQQKDQKDREQHQQQLVSMFESNVNGARKTYPDLFAESDGDNDGNDMISKGNKLVAIAFSGQGLSEGMTEAERSEAIVKAQAQVAVRAAAFGRERLRFMAAQKEIESLKSQLKAFEKSEPPTGSTDRGEETKEERSWEDEIDSLPGAVF